MEENTRTKIKTERDKRRIEFTEKAKEYTQVLAENPREDGIRRENRK